MGNLKLITVQSERVKTQSSIMCFFFQRTFDFLYERNNSRRPNSDKNITLSKFQERSQPFMGLKFQRFPSLAYEFYIAVFNPLNYQHATLPLTKRILAPLVRYQLRAGILLAFLALG